MPAEPVVVQDRSDQPILFVRQRYAPFGGGELMLDHTMSELAGRGLPVAILARAWPDDRHGIRFFKCDPPRVPRPFRAKAFASAACAAIADIGPRLTQSNDRLSCCDIFRAGEGVHAAYLAERRRGASLVEKASLALSLFHRETLRLERETYANPGLRAVIAISDMVADDILCHYAFPAERIHRIPNGVDLKRFNPSVRDHHRSSVRASLGTGSERTVVLFVGSGFARKGLMAAIEAIRHIPDTELWVIGHDSHQRRFAAAASRFGVAARVRFLGPQADPLPWYGAADVAVLPSIYEPFGTVVLEAMACGLPTVVSRSCGARELVSRFDGRLVKDTLSISELVDGLTLSIDLARHPDTVNVVRGAAALYGFDVMISRMISLYDTLLMA